MKSNASLVYGLVLVVGDFLALVAGFALAYAIRGPLSSVPVANPIPASEYINIFLLLLPFWILIFGLLGLYSNSIQEQRFRELGRLLVGAFIGLLFIIGYGYITDKIIFPARLVPVYGFVLAFIFLVIFRNLAREARAYLYRYDVGITNVLIVGNTKVAREMVATLADSRISGYKIVGVIGNKVHTADHFSHIPIFEDFEQAARKLKPDNVHSIVQTELYADQERNNELLEFAQTHHIAYRFIPGNSEMFVGNIEVELFRSQLPVISVHQTPLFGWGRFVKRVFDLLFGGLLLLIASPFILAIAILNLFSGGGGVFFRQVRLTRFNQEFKVYKFRTQYKKYDGTTPEAAFSMMDRPELAKKYRANGDYLKKDPRVTPFGRFLRKTSLDELPQLFNVVKGDLSLVGPRALIPEELSVYEKKHAILSVKSGLTGLAQVSGRRSIDFNERRQLDVFYVQNWSFWMDLVILIKTVRVVISGRGAA
jgi:exopolysaccharide biosynthesis polyprenyl glycosylphosphotransferase